MMISPSELESPCGFGRDRLGMEIVVRRRPRRGLASWCGSSPVQQNHQATCRKRKHIRPEPSGIAEIDDPHRHFKIVRPDAGVIDLPDEGAAEYAPPCAVNSAPHSRPNTMTRLREFGPSMLTNTSTPTWMPVRTP